MPSDHSPASKKSNSSSSSVPEVDPPKSSWLVQAWQNQQENIRLLVIALIIAVVVRVWIAEPRFIPSNSMNPTLHIGDRLIVEKVSYYLHPPQRGDIVVFSPPPQLQQIGYRPQQAFIKRVIATPGQTIAVHQGQVVVNNQPLEEPYILEPPNYEMPLITVPKGYLFVMGDNRNDSNDSHVWGFLPQQNVIGHATLRFWPFERLGEIG